MSLISRGLRGVSTLRSTTSRVSLNAARPSFVRYNSRRTSTGLAPRTEKTSVKFTLSDQPGSLNAALKYFDDHGVNLSKLESRPSKTGSNFDMYVDFIGEETQPNVRDLLNKLRSNFSEVSLLQSRKVPWFPKRLKELDRIANLTLDAGEDLHSDHPGFSDMNYRRQRERIAKIANEYSLGETIKSPEYSAEENATWAQVYDHLMPLVKKHGCREHNRMFQLMEQNCGYKASHIPHLQDINDFLQDSTGFQMRPVAGLLSSRNFLYGLAFRVFFSTQYIRHHSKPLYTPEPDVCHELLGHAPLFADKTFADFSQEIGLASLGATDDQIIRLARCYWFSVEFGLCLEDGERKAYGAGLLSSFGELEYSMSDEPEVRPWDPENAGMQDFPITTYQPIYYAANSFEDARLQMSAYASSFSRPFNVRFDPYTSRVNIDANIEMDEPTAADASKPDGY